MKIKYLGILSLIIVFASCGRNVEGMPEINCDPDPVTHEIVWEMGVGVQNASVIIKPGDTVRWVWGENDMPHDVSSNDSNAPDDFGSGIMTGEGSTYEYTFTEEMVFDYFCSIHPTTMFGTITVTECEEN